MWTGRSSSCAADGAWVRAPCTRRVTPRPTTPASATWRRLADAPEGADRGFGAAVWTGEEMIVIFGDPGFGFAYDPARDRWRSIDAARPRPDPRGGGPAPRSSSEPIPGGDGRRLPARSRGWHLAPASRHGFRSSRRGEGASLDRRPARRLGASPPATRAPPRADAPAGRRCVRSISDPGLPSIEWYEGTPGSPRSAGMRRASGSWSGRRTATSGRDTTTSRSSSTTPAPTPGPSMVPSPWATSSAAHDRCRSRPATRSR